MDAIKRFFSTITWAQVLTVIIVPAAISAVNSWVPAGPIHDGLLMILGAGGVQSMVSNRKPSLQGGTTKTA